MTKTNKIVYYILLVIISFMFIMSGYMKVSGDPMSVAGFAKAHLPIWFMYFIGAAEILGGIALWIPKLAKWSSYGLYVIMAGAVVVTICFDNPVFAVVPLIVAALIFSAGKLRTKRSESDPMNQAPTSAPMI